MLVKDLFVVKSFELALAVLGYLWVYDSFYVEVFVVGVFFMASFIVEEEIVDAEAPLLQRL
jgi:hypothetical protein